MPLPKHIVLEVHVEDIGRIGYFYPATERLDIDPGGAVLRLTPQRLVDIMRALIKRNRVGMLLEAPVVVFPFLSDIKVVPSSIPGVLEPVDHGNTMIKPDAGKHDMFYQEHLRRVEHVKMQRAQEECKLYEVTPEERLNILVYFGADSLTDVSDQMWMQWENHRRLTDRVDAVLDKMNGQEFVMTPVGLRTMAEMEEALAKEQEEVPYHVKVWEED